MSKFSMLKYSACAASIALACIAGNGSAYEQCNHDHHANRQIKNIIVLMPDGCNQAIQTLCRWYSGKALTLDSMTSGAVRTWSANSIITGSAAASTAFGTGFKTEEPFIGVGPSSNGSGKGLLTSYVPPYPLDYLGYRPLADVIEGAKSVGKATGMVVTVTMSHASPAGQSAHVDNRANEQDIIEQEVYQNIDVAFGGGKKALVTRTDHENLLDTLLSRGYQWVETRDQMLALTSGKAWGLFAGDYMQPDIDRPEIAPSEPPLAEMTKKAIDLLSQHREGFFLFVEGSQTDFGDHNNDPIYSVSDFLAFDKAVQTALEFAKADGHTAVIAFPDHNCGGMTIGSYYSDTRVAYDHMPLEYLLNPLKGMLLTSIGVAKKIADTTNGDQIKSAVKTWWNIALADSDVSQIFSWPYSKIFSYRLAEVVSKNYTGLGWTTHGHDGSDVPLWVYNCDLHGTIENTDLAKKMFELFDIDSKKLNEDLFVNVNDVFPGAWTLDKTDATNPVLVVTAGGIDFRMPASKDEIYYSKPGKPVVKKLLRGLVVNAPKSGRVYLPSDAVRIINRIAGE
jgi:alkaline phosphatase